MSDLNTLIQFFAAIYLTITIDNLVFKRFWTPDLYSVVDAKLNEFNFALSSHLNNTLMKQIKNFASSIDRKARRRGGYILLLCISTMIFTTFESSFVSSKEYYFAFNITLLCAFVGYFIGIFMWEKWLSVFLTYFILLIVFVVNIIYCKFYFEVSDNLLSSLLFGKCLLIVFLVIPLIIRLFLNWLNSTIYIDYLVNELGMEKTRYNKTIGSIQSGDSTGCDPAYNSAFKEAYFNKENNTDQLNTKMSELLVERIIDICSKREFWFLCVYFFKNLHKNKNNQIIESPYTEKYSLPIIAQTDETYSNLLKEYEAMKGTKKLRDFCAENKVDYEDFRHYRSTRLILKSTK